MSTTKIVEYGWIRLINGKIHEVRPAKEPALMELKRGDDFQSALRNLQVAEWRLAPGQIIPVDGDAEIELQRDGEYELLRGRAATVRIPEALEEQVRKIQRRYEVNGWDFREVFCSMDRGRLMVFTKREGARDVQPFVEPHIKE